MTQKPSAATERPRLAINDCWNKIGVRGDGSCPELKRYVHCRNCPVHASAAALLLDGLLPPGYQSEWTRHIAEPKQGEQAGTHSIVIFRIGVEWLALPTAVLAEVAEQGRVHSLPHRLHGVVQGLTNVRGELLVCVSLSGVLGLDLAQQSSRTAYKRLMVIRHEGDRLVFPVDEVFGIHHYHPDELREAPATVAKAAAAYIKAMLPWQDKAVGCLDEQLLFYKLNRSLA